MLSTYLKNKLINGVLRNTQYTVPTKVYLALYSSDPTVADSGAELSGGNYARIEVAFDAPTLGVTQNTSDLTFPTATSEWVTATHFGIKDALTSGNLLYFGELSASRKALAGHTILILDGQLTITME